MYSLRRDEDVLQFLVWWKVVRLFVFLRYNLNLPSLVCMSRWQQDIKPIEHYFIFTF